MNKWNLKYKMSKVAFLTDRFIQVYHIYCSVLFTDLSVYMLHYKTYMGRIINIQKSITVYNLVM